MIRGSMYASQQYIYNSSKEMDDTPKPNIVTVEKNLMLEQRNSVDTDHRISHSIYTNKTPQLKKIHLKVVTGAQESQPTSKDLAEADEL